jgi:class 3 adenylate cyclase
VLISEAVATRSTQPLAPLGQHKLRGAARPVELFTLPERAPH